MSRNNLTWTILEKFSQLTRSIEEGASSAPSHIIKQVEFLRGHVFGGSSSSSNTEYELDEAAKLYLSRWAASLVNSTKHEPDYEHVFEEEYSNEGFELLDVEDTFKMKFMSNDKISSETIRNWKDENGMFTRSKEHIIYRMFSGLTEKEAKQELWPFLLSFYEWNSTEDQRKKTYEQKSNIYLNLIEKLNNNKSVEFNETKFNIKKDALRTDRNVDFYSENVENTNPETTQIDQSLPGSNEQTDKLERILNCYAIYNRDLGYVQGMSDLLSPILYILKDECISFWCFEYIMKRTKENFSVDQRSMHNQLKIMEKLTKLSIPKLYIHLLKIDSNHMFFMYRMLLVLFRREFKFNDCIDIIEILMTNYIKNFHYFVALAILDIHHTIIIKYTKNSDDVLRYIIDLSSKLNLTKIMKRAEYLFYLSKKKITKLKDDNKLLGEFECLLEILDSSNLNK